jgi:hypothetical protein
MARSKPKGITTSQFDEWVKQGRPEDTFLYRGKTLQAPMPGIYEGLMRGGSTRLHRIDPVKLKVLQEQVEAAQEKQATDLKDLKAEAVSLWKKDNSHACKLGEVLLKIKSLLKHGEFTKWWTEAEFSQARVSYCMRLAAPEGDKVKTSKDKAKKSPRTKAVSSISKKVAALYDAIAKESDNETLEQIIDEIITEVKEFMLTVERKKPAAPKKAKAARAAQ